METFAAFQALAAQTPVSLRNNRDRLLLPVTGLQQEAGKVGALFGGVLEAGGAPLSAAQQDEFRDRMADLLWCMARLCEETGVSLASIAEHCAHQLQARANTLNPDQR